MQLSKKSAKPIPWDTAIKILESTKHIEDRLILALGFTTAFRCENLLNLKFKDVMDGANVKATLVVEKECKTYKRREVPINHLLKECILAHHRQLVQKMYYSDEMYLIGSYKDPRRRNPVSRQFLNTRIKRCVKPFMSTDRISSHSLRKTFGKRIYEKEGCTDKALLITSMALNHKDIYVTRRYIGLDEEVLANVFDHVDHAKFSVL